MSFPSLERSGTMHVTIVTIMVNMELMMTVVSYRTSDGGSYHPLGKTKMMVRKKIKKNLY